MTRWLRLDADFAENVKIAHLTDRAFRFHVAGLCYCARNLTDGHVSARAVKVLAAVVEAQKSSLRTDELVKARLWHPDEDGDGFWINDYLKKQESRQEVDARSNAGRIGARKRWANAERTATANAQTDKQLNPKPKAVNEASYDGTAQEETVKLEILRSLQDADAAA